MPSGGGVLPGLASADLAQWLRHERTVDREVGPVHAARLHRALPQVCPFRHVRHRRYNRQWRPVG